MVRRKASSALFQNFVCVGHEYVPIQKRTELDDKGKKCVMLGIGDKSEAYKMYNPAIKKMLISRDLVFAENKFCPWDSLKEIQKI